MNYTGQVMQAMAGYYAGEIYRINHYLKVYSLAISLAELEKLDENTRTILGIAALTHDIGIKGSMAKYGSPAGKYQQIEGPPEAEKMLTELGVPGPLIERVCWLIARHHEYENITAIDHQILVEADFLVNAHEGRLEQKVIRKFKTEVFRTESGKKLLSLLYKLE